ncbi:sulfotransferase family protein [Actinospongicola halichondriae]|uniref:sulfotransferase family protein n=1 Tax=Actinospongicola halichondriae TaxID=3236844 RepID=UPI003D41921D
MTLPDFLVLGAARSATTSLHYYLDQHPRIVMSSIKEPNHFAFDHSVDPPAPLIDPTSPIVTKSIPGRQAYEDLFAHGAADAVAGEASPLYLYVRETPEQVAKVLTDPRFVAVLRNPIDRAYSHWLHIRRESADAAVEGFRRSCEAEMAAGREYTPYAGASHVLRMGLYDEQLQRYADRFGAERVLALSYDDVVGDPQSQVDRICDHVGVERHVVDTDTQFNRSGVTRSRTGAAVTAAMRSAQPKLKAVLPPSVTRRLGRLRAQFDRPDEAPPVPEDLREQLAEWFAPSVHRAEAEGWVPAGTWTDFA